MTTIAYTAIHPDTGSFSTDAIISEGVVLLDKTTHLLTDPFAEVEFTTDAELITVTYYNDIYTSFPSLTRIGIYIDGVYSQSLTPSALGSTTVDVQFQPGEKLVSFASGPQTGTGVSGSKGCFVTALNFTDGNASQSSELTANRIMAYGDSIAVGQGSDEVMQTCWMAKVRQANHPYVASCDARGFRTLHDDTSTAPLKATFIAKAVERNPATLWVGIGTNDYALNRWSAADFGTAYGALLDDLHTALPSLQIYCQSPIIRSVETANNLGDTTQDYRDAIATAVSSRTSYATYINGLAITTLDGIGDGVHPNQVGHDAIYNTISSELSISIPTPSEPVQMSNVKLWRGAVEPSEVSATGNQYKAYRGAVEPAYILPPSVGDGFIVSLVGSLVKPLVSNLVN